MRLTTTEHRQIVAALARELHVWKGELYLFGSRMSDQKKGGDIDLLLIVPESHVDEAKSKKVFLIDAIHGAIGEQRIDLTIASPQQFDSDPFLQSIGEQKVRLA